MASTPTQRISEHGDPSEPRHELLQDLQAFAADRLIEIAQPRHVSTGARQGSPPGRAQPDQSQHDDGDCSGSFLGRQCCRAGARHQDIHFETDKLGHQLGHPFIPPLGPADFQRDRLPFHVAQVSEPLPERLEPMCPTPLCGCADNIADARDFWRRLCAGGKRPGRSATEKGDELASLHSTTSSELTRPGYQFSHAASETIAASQRVRWSEDRKGSQH